MATDLFDRSCDERVFCSGIFISFQSSLQFNDGLNYCTGRGAELSSQGGLMKALERNRICSNLRKIIPLLKEGLIFYVVASTVLGDSDLQLELRGHIQKALFSAFCLVFKFYQLTHSGDTVFCLLSCPQFSNFRAELTVHLVPAWFSRKVCPGWGFHLQPADMTG